MKSFLVRAALCVAFVGFIIVKYFTAIGIAYPFGWAPATEKNIAVNNGIPVGCTCHNEEASNATEINLHPLLADQSIVASNQYEFVVAVSSPSQLAAGVNISAFAGKLDTILGEGLTFDNWDAKELMHSQPRPMMNGKTAWRFRYTAPIDRTTDTIYAVSNAVNGNGDVDNGDLWNLAPKYIVNITPKSGVSSSKAMTVRVAPNPASDLLSVTCASQLTKISIADLVGREVRSTVANANPVTLDLRDLPAGTYVLTAVGSDGKVHSEKFMVR